MSTTDTDSGRSVVQALGLPANTHIVRLRLRDVPRATGDPGWLGGAASASKMVPLLLIVDNPRSLRSLLAAEGHSDDGAAVAHPEPTGVAALESLFRALRGLGLEQRLLLPYPDAASARWIVDTRMFGDPEGRALVAALVRQPIRGDQRSVPLAQDPNEAFRARLADGSVLDLPENYVIVAGSSSATSLEGERVRMWVRTPESWAESWHRTRSLERSDSGWRLNPPVGSVGAGVFPFVLDLHSVHVPVGENGEDRLADVLGRQGDFIDEARKALEDWARAARDLVADAPPGRMPHDLSPSRFVVTTESSWLPLPQDVRLAIGLPFAALAYGGLVRTLPRLVARSVLPRKLEALSAAAAATTLLQSLGVQCGPEDIHLWHETEAALAHRMERERPSLESARADSSKLSREPLWTSLLYQPRDRLAETMAVGRLAIAGRSFRGKLTAHEAKVRQLKRQLDSQASKLEAARQALSVTSDDERALREQLLEKSDVLELRRAELAWCEWQHSHEKAIVPLSERGADGPSPVEREIETVRASDLFDARWYLARYPDIAASGMDPAFHWVRYGAAEGRDPGPAFRTKGYVLAHHDVLEPGTNPLVHLLATRPPSPSAPSLHRLDGSAAMARVAFALDELAHGIESDEDYVAAVERDEPWLAAAHAIFRQLGIEVSGRSWHSPGRTPVVVVPPGHVVKFYVGSRPRRSVESELAGRASLLESELLMHERLGREPSLPVPRLVAHGPLGSQIHYLVMTLIPGVPFSTVMEELPEQRAAVVAWLGAFVRTLHAVRLTPNERAEEWPRFAAWAGRRRSTVAQRLAHNRALPRHLLDQVEGWLPTADEMIGKAEDAVVTHGSLQWKHVLGHVEGNVFRPTGVVDLNSGSVGSPLLDLGRLWKRILGTDRDLTSVCMKHARLKELDEPGFPRRALAWGLMCSPHLPVEIPWLADVADLDELAERSFGGLMEQPGDDANGMRDTSSPALGSGSTIDLAEVGTVMDRVLRNLQSDEEYYAAIRRDEPWVTAARLICQHLGLETAGILEHMPYQSRTPVILTPSGLAVKFYANGWPRQSAGTRQARGRTLLENEVVMLTRLGRDPGLPVPKLIDHGTLGEEWSYLVMTSVPGISFERVRDQLPPTATLAMVRWLGAFVRRLHAVPVFEEERETEWAQFASVIEYRASKLPGLLGDRRLLPDRLLADLERWMPTLDELLGSPDQVVVVHGDLRWRHVLGFVTGDTFTPAGIIDVNEGGIGTPMYDLGRTWWSALSWNRKLLEAYLTEADFPGVSEPGFPRLALAWGLMWSSNSPLQAPWLDDVRSLDELAERCFGGLRAAQS